ncbi:nuclear transcription factor Y subunit beta-like [Nilaparvata lugens]|uniref:nuclear transcription factor Y subunit beta-like n=1 Tax=Nilaparvata lugens TaxID=108931 RepID=UPI000B98B3FF|nr:nuclear transcription factor Y subunit beta-like [Nilaparvata lugens]
MIIRLSYVTALVLIYNVLLIEGQNDPAGASFLQSVVRRIQTDRFQSLSRVISNRLNALDKSDTANYETDPEVRNILLQILSTPPTDSEQHSHYEDLAGSDGDNHMQDDIPPAPLSKQELLALYQAAVSKGTNLTSMGQQLSENDLTSTPEQGTIPGYYYYFYPIKNLMGNGNDGQNQQMDGNNNSGMMTQQDMAMMMMQQGPTKSIQPLFFAMASFVSVAMMFVLSILFMPKFGNHRSDAAAVKEAASEENLTDLSKIVFEAIEGKDCSERLACELGQAVRVMQVGNKPLRAMEILLPPHLAKQVALVRKSASKRESCNYIACLEYASDYNNNNYKLRQNNNNDLRNNSKKHDKTVKNNKNSSNNNKNNNNNQNSKRKVESRMNESKNNDSINTEDNSNIKKSKKT